jgi:hypothetical protein
MGVSFALRTPRLEDTHHPPYTLSRTHGGGVCLNGCGAHARSRRVAPDGLGRRPPIFLLAYSASTHDTTGLTAGNLVFGRELSLPVTYYLVLPPTRSHSPWTSWIGYTTATTAPANTWSWPAIEWKRAMTAWLTTNMATNCGCIAQPAVKGIRPVLPFDSV